MVFFRSSIEERTVSPNPNLTNGESPPPKEIPDMSSATFVSVVGFQSIVFNFSRSEHGQSLQFANLLPMLRVIAFGGTLLSSGGRPFCKFGYFRVGSFCVCRMYIFLFLFSPLSYLAFRAAISSL